MASITTEPNGRRTVQFVAGDGRRRSIRLGKTPARTAEGVKIKVEALIAASLSRQSPEPEVSEWVGRLDDTMHAKLAAVGLVKPRSSMTLDGFLTAYIDERVDVKPATREVLEHVKRNLIACFGEGKSLRDLTTGDGDAFRLHLINDGLGDNTVRRRCGIAKQFMRAAVRKGLVNHNAFADLVAAVQANVERFHFVSREHAKRVLDACPDAQWRLLFALSRFGGLRCPSEHLALTWADIDWERNRIRVPSPKTEHHAGGASRVIPLFPELRPYLLEVFEKAEPGTVNMITRYRDSRTNLRTQLERIIRKAGLEPWPKLWVNLRSTRETELAETFPIHVVTRWIGNSEPVAAKHYLQVTDEHFSRASGSPAESVQNPVQQAHVTGRKASQGEKPGDEKTPVLQGFASGCKNVQGDETGPVGLEPTTL